MFQGTLGAEDPVRELASMRCHFAYTLMAWLRCFAFCANPFACAHLHS